MGDSAAVTADYRVQLDVFSGPLDLLLYLIRRDEVDIYDIPIAHLTEQYVSHVRTLQELDPNAAGEFLVLAATLLEIKSRALLPTPPADAADTADDPRTPLVKQLLEYKRFKDAARALGSAADDRARKFVRKPGALPQALQGIELEEASVWDLLGAFTAVMTAVGRGPGLHEVRYDDTPIELYQAEILAQLERSGMVTFESLFAEPQDRMQIIGRFLALLELIRARQVRAEQERAFGAIYLFLLVEANGAEADDEPANNGIAAPPATPPAAPPESRAPTAEHNPAPAATPHTAHPRNGSAATPVGPDDPFTPDARPT